MRSEYWARLSFDGRPLGGGMVVQRGGVVLTAAHCLHGVPAGSDVVVEFADGLTGAARVEEIADWDIALVVAHDPDLCDIPPPDTDVCRAEDRWFAPYRPSVADPHLSGSVIAERSSYRLFSGAEVAALQLDVHQELGDYSGYSGGPVERDGSLIGIMLEQYLDRQLPDRASNVLFAATIREALDRFRRFENDHLFPRRGQAGTRETAEAELRQLREWREQGLVEQPVAEAIQLRILDEWLGTER